MGEAVVVVADVVSGGLVRVSGENMLERYAECSEGMCNCVHS